MPRMRARFLFATSWLTPATYRQGMPTEEPRQNGDDVYSCHHRGMAIYEDVRENRTEYHFEMSATRHDIRRFATESLRAAKAAIDMLLDAGLMSTAAVSPGRR